MVNEDKDFIDPDSEIGREVNSIKELILRHLSKISEISMKEFRSGFYEVVGYNPSRKIYHPDTRECYINGVAFLYDILYPKFDEEMTKVDKEIQEEEIKALKEVEPKTPTSKVKIIYSRKMFRELNLLIHRKKMFETTGGWQ